VVTALPQNDGLAGRQLDGAYLAHLHHAAFMRHAVQLHAAGGGAGNTDQTRGLFAGDGQIRHTAVLSRHGGTRPCALHLDVCRMDAGTQQQCRNQPTEPIQIAHDFLPDKKVGGLYPPAEKNEQATIRATGLPPPIRMAGLRRKWPAIMDVAFCRTPTSGSAFTIAP